MKRLFTTSSSENKKNKMENSTLNELADNPSDSVVKFILNFSKAYTAIPLNYNNSCGIILN